MTGSIAPLVQDDFEESHEERVLALLRARSDGLADFEIEDELGLPHRTACPRRNALVKRGLVQDSGRKRVTKTGRPAAVWVAVVVADEPVAVDEPLLVEVPQEKMRTPKRIEFEKKMDLIQPLLAEGKGVVEIATILGLEKTTVSHAKRELELASRAATKLDRDFDRFDAALPALTGTAADLARRYSAEEPTTKTTEELAACVKNLAESVRRLRGLQGVLRALVEARAEPEASTL